MRKNQVERPWRGPALLAGIIQGSILSLLPVGVGWFVVNLAVVSLVEIVAVAAMPVLALVSAWSAGYLVLRLGAVPRAGVITWCTTGSTVVVGSLAGVIVGAGAFVSAQLTVAMLWSGAMIEPILLTTFALQSVVTIAVAVSASLVAAGSFSRRSAEAP